MGTGPRLKPAAERMQRVGLLPIDVKALEISTGGIREFRVDWSEACIRNVAKSFETHLAPKGYHVVQIPESLVTDELYEVTKMLELTCAAVQTHLYGPYPFEGKITSFDYAVGSLSSVCSRMGIDALMLVYGFDEAFSPGRKQLLETQHALRTVRAGLLGFLTGTIYLPERVRERAVLVCAIADSSGAVIWYDHRGQAKDDDFRLYADASAFVKEMVDKLPPVKKARTSSEVTRPQVDDRP